MKWLPPKKLTISEDDISQIRSSFSDILFEEAMFGTGEICNVR